MSENDGLRVVSRGPLLKPRPRTFFDSVPHDVLLNIVSYVFPAMRMPSSLRLMKFFFSSANPFQTVASYLFTSVSFKGYANRTYAHIDSGTIYVSSYDVDSSGLNATQVQNMWSVCGGSVSRIKFTEIENETRRLEKFVNAVLRHCPNVDSLVMNASWNRKHGGDCTVKLFEKYATQLRSIECDRIGGWRGMDWSNCTNLRQFICSSVTGSRLITILKSIGVTLEELRVYNVCGRNRVDVLDMIQKSCKRITVLVLPLEAYEHRMEKYASLLCSYSEQLIEANVCELDCENLRRICDSCPQLRLSCRLSFISDSDDEYEFQCYGDDDESDECNGNWMRFTVMAPVLVELLIANNLTLRADTERVMARCTHLLKLDINGQIQDGDYTTAVTTDSDMKALFFSSSFHALEELYIHGLIPSETNINLVASSTSRLKRVNFVLAEHIEDGSVFQSLVDSNPCLTEVNVDEMSMRDEMFESDCMRSASSALDLMRSLLETFSMCRELDFYVRHMEGEEDKDWDEEAMEEELRKLRRCVKYRGADVTMGVTSARYRQEGW